MLAIFAQYPWTFLGTTYLLRLLYVLLLPWQFALFSFCWFALSDALCAHLSMVSVAKQTQFSSDCAFANTWLIYFVNIVFSLRSVSFLPQQSIHSLCFSFILSTFELPTRFVKLNKNLLIKLVWIRFWRTNYFAFNSKFDPQLINSLINKFNATLGNAVNFFYRVFHSIQEAIWKFMKLEFSLNFTFWFFNSVWLCNRTKCFWISYLRKLIFCCGVSVKFRECWRVSGSNHWLLITNSCSNRLAKLHFPTWLHKVTWSV